MQSPILLNHIQTLYSRSTTTTSGGKIAHHMGGGGGFLMYVRSDIACDRKDKLEFKCIDSIMVDIYINIRKWIITGVYRPPSIKDENYSNDFIIVNHI